MTKMSRDGIGSRKNIMNRDRTGERDRTGISKDKIDSRNNTMNRNRILLVGAMGVGLVWIKLAVGMI